MKQGKRNRINGANFERKVRKDLTEKGWNVCRWDNQVIFGRKFKYQCWDKKGLLTTEEIDIIPLDFNKLQKNVKKLQIKYNNIFNDEVYDISKVVPAKAKFNPFTKRVMNMSSGFPDFIAYKFSSIQDNGPPTCTFHDWRSLMKVIPFNHINMLFVECKSNGCLDKIEKEKAKWYLDNNYCSKFLIVSKKKVGRKVEVEYNEV